MLHSAPAFGFSMSLSTDNTAPIEASVSPDSSTIIGSNTLHVTSTCPDGYYIYATSSDPNLYHNGDATETTNKISVSSGSIATPTPLESNQWGISLNPSSSTFFGVSSENTALRTPSDYTTSQEDIPLYYGISIGNLPAGTYTSPDSQATVTYSLVPNLSCVSVTFQFSSGSLGEGQDPEVTGSMEDFDASYNSSVIFPDNNFTRTHYNFAGWSTKDNDDPDSPDANELHFLGDGTSELIDESAIYNRTSNGTLTLYPMWRSSKIYIQNWKGCSNLNIGDIVTLYDNRDEQAYRVAKWKMNSDGSQTKCWMMDNLNLGAITLETDLTSENTNLTEEIPAATFNSWKGTSGTNSYTVGRFITRTTGDTYGNNYGTLYNYYVASARTKTTSSNSTGATADICPAGWRLPTGGSSGEFANLVSAYSLSGSTGITSLRQNFGFPLAGYTSTSSPTNVGTRGYYWSSTYGGSAGYMYRFYLYSSTISSTNTGYRYNTSSIKCVVSETVTITFDKNDESATGNMDPLKIELGNANTLPSNGFSHPTLIFTGWNTAPDGSGIRYADGSTITPSSSNNFTLYAQWKDASEIQTVITLTNTSATTTGSTSTTINYGANSASITNPQRKYTTSFSTSYNNASGASVSSSSPQTATYTFNGWYTASSGGTKIINANGTLVANTAYTDNSGNWKSVEPALTLYAQWTSASITLPAIEKTDATCGWGTSTNTSTITYTSGATYTPSSSRALYGVCKLYAYLDTGANVNAKMKSLAAGASKSQNDYTSDITAIKKSTSLPSGFTATTANTISTGANPVYIYMSGSTLYYYSTSTTIYMNADSGGIFRRHSALSDISGLTSLDASKVTSLYAAFAASPKITSLSPISGWNVSKVQNMSFLFGFGPTDIDNVGFPSLTSLSGLSSWNTSSVTNLSYAFQNQVSLTNISAISGWNVSKVTALDNTFASVPITSLSSLSSWDVSKVTSMKATFALLNEAKNAGYTAKLTNASSINNWHVENVTNFQGMFSQQSVHPDWTYVTGTWDSDGTFTPD